jgi:hypothetical protein
LVQSVIKRLAALGIRIALSATKIEALRTALGCSLNLPAIDSGGGFAVRIARDQGSRIRCRSSDPVDSLRPLRRRAGRLLLGLLATWIPAQRALAVKPLILLREDCGSWASHWNECMPEVATNPYDPFSV